MKKDDNVRYISDNWHLYEESVKSKKLPSNNDFSNHEAKFENACLTKLYQSFLRYIYGINVNYDFAKEVEFIESEDLPKCRSFVKSLNDYVNNNAKSKKCNEYEGDPEEFDFSKSNDKELNDSIKFYCSFIYANREIKSFLSSVKSL